VTVWQNPEFIRHVRAELRLPRAVTVAAISLVICGLIGLSCWGAAGNEMEFFRLTHYWLVGTQFAVLGFWCASACGQAISRERELKTFDFLRTTRLTSWDLMVGKVFGAPVLAYFAVGCTLPISVLAGLLAGIAPSAILGVYVLLVAFTLFVALLGLWISMLIEKSNAGVLFLVVLLLVGGAYVFAALPVKGFGAISVMPALLTLYRAGGVSGQMSPTLFGFPVPYLVLTLMLYATFGAWVVLMLLRGLKKERQEIRLLSHWQAIGFVAFLNILYYAFLDPEQLMAFRLGDLGGSHVFGPREAAQVAIVFNAGALFLVGLAMMGSREKLRVWWRRWNAGQESYLSGDGLAWPWIAIGAAVAYGLLAAEVLGVQAAIPVHDWRLGFAGIVFVEILVFVVRDVLFIQWCTLTRMNRPLFKGFLFLTLYYAAAGIVSSVVGLASGRAGSLLLGLLTPWQMLGLEDIGFAPAHASYIGLALQMGAAVFLVMMISRRLGRPPALVPATSS
jgi:hypothetical protein